MYIHNKDGRFNEVTGEFLFYENTPYRVLEIAVDNRHFYEARDREELFDIVKRYKEKRYSEVNYLLDRNSLGKWYVPILTLCSKVDYFNVGFHNREDMCKIFGVSDGNLNKTLNRFQKINLLKYTGKGLTRSHQIRVIWNPQNVWKGFDNSIIKMICIQDWYKGYFGCVDSESTHVSTDTKDSVIEYIDVPPKHSPDPYVSPFYKFDNKDRFNQLMDISDAEFELLLLGITQVANATS